MALTNAEKQARYRAKKKLLAAIEGPGGGDRASELVHAKGMELLRDGTLVPTIKDVLSAERLIDARAKNEGQKQAVFALAAALSGYMRPLPAPPIQLEDPTITDGEFTEVD